MADLNIPEDLQNWHNVAVRERTSDIKHIYTAEDCIALIERIATAEAEVAQLKADLSAEMQEAYRIIKQYVEDGQRFTFNDNEARVWLSTHGEYAPKKAGENG